MNKYYVLCALCLGLSAQAQTTINESTASAGSRASIAPSIGVTSFALKAEGYEVGASAGLSVGAQYAHPISEELDFELGLHYFETGGKQGDAALIENKLTFAYISAPLGVRYKFLSYGEAAQNKIYVKGGAAPSYLVSAKQKVTVLGESEESDIKADTNSFDLMAYVGLGTSYNMAPSQSLLVELSYFYGTQKVLKDFESRNEGLMASVMYSFEM